MVAPGEPIPIASFDEVLPLLLDAMGREIEVMIGPDPPTGYVFAMFRGTLDQAEHNDVWRLASGVPEEETFTLQLSEQPEGYVVLYRQRFDGAELEQLAPGIAALTIRQEGVAITLHLPGDLSLRFRAGE